MKLENNDSVLKQHDDVKGLPLNDTVVFRPDPHAPEPVVEKKENVSSHRLRDINDFC